MNYGCRLVKQSSSTWRRYKVGCCHFLPQLRDAGILDEVGCREKGWLDIRCAH